MKPNERYLSCMRFEDIDRLPLMESGAWPSTRLRWQRESLGEANQPPEFIEFENKKSCGVDLWMQPRFAEELLFKDEEYITKRTEYGIVERQLKSPDEMSMPEHVDYPVKSRGDWEKLKNNFNPNDTGRFPDEWQKKCTLWEKQGAVVVFQGSHSPSLFGFVRDLMGPERTLMAFYDDPVMVNEMMDVYTDFIMGILPKVIDDSPLTAVYFWEDMCYKNGPLISPAMFKEFMTPRYKRITDMVRSKGIDTVFVDSDGDVTELIPLWIEAGINGVYPMEVTAGMDVGKLREQYGKNLIMHGGIDKRVLTKGKDAIDDELKSRILTAEKGGYIPHIDHSIPHDVSYEAFAYYWKKKKELLGIADSMSAVV